MREEKNTKKLSYEKAFAEVIRFDTSGGGGCVTWSNQNGVGCHFGLTE